MTPAANWLPGILRAAVATLLIDGLGCAVDNRELKPIEWTITEVANGGSASTETSCQLWAGAAGCGTSGTAGTFDTAGNAGAWAVQIPGQAGTSIGGTGGIPGGTTRAASTAGFAGVELR